MKLMTKFDYSITPEKSGLTVMLVRNSDKASISFYIVNGSISLDDHLKNMHRHMETLTDAQCSEFYPDMKTKEGEKEYEVPDFSSVKGMEVNENGCFILKKNKPLQVTPEVFHAELMKRFGKGPANKWLDEYKEKNGTSV